MKNISEMEFNYEWNFVEDEINGESVGGEERRISKRKSKIDNDDGSNKENYPINEVFDILPLSGNL